MPTPDPAAASSLRCGACDFETTPEAMYDHIQECDGWVSYEGHALADLAREAGFEPVLKCRSWLARVILRRKDRYVLER